MNTHSTVLNDASAEPTTPDRILQTALVAWRQGNFVAAANQFNEQFTFTDHALGLEFKDTGRLTEFLAKTRELFPDSERKANTIFSSGDRVISEWTLTADLPNNDSGNWYKKWAASEIVRFITSYHQIMKFKLYCFLIVLAHPCLGLSSTEPSEGTDAWGSFLKIDRDIPIITPEKARDPILRQNLSRTLVAYEEFRSLIKHKGDWVGADFAQGYFSQLNGDQQMLHSMIGGYSFSRAKYIDIDELDTVLDDLYLKINACLLNGGKAVGSVSVIVHTKKSGIEVPNWRVVCMAKILLLYHNYSPTAFPQLSSPTKWQIPPGNYHHVGRKSRDWPEIIDARNSCRSKPGM